MRFIRRWLIRVFKLHGTLDTERALREKNVEILRLRHEVAELKKYSLFQVPLQRQANGTVAVSIDQSGMKQAQREITQQSAVYEPPEPRTGPIIKAPHGDVFRARHKEYMLTEHMPVISPLRKRHLERMKHDEFDDPATRANQITRSQRTDDIPGPDDTGYSIPTFLL